MSQSPNALIAKIDAITNWADRGWLGGPPPHLNTFGAGPDEQATPLVETYPIEQEPVRIVDLDNPEQHRALRHTRPSLSEVLGQVAGNNL